MERIGEGLHRLGKLDSDQIERVIAAQRSGDNRLFGEIAVSQNYLRVDDLLYYVRDSGKSEQDLL